MAKHTPGPWRLATKSNFGNLIEADSGKRGGIGAGLPDEGYRTVAMYQACCTSERYDDQEENRLANGLLIAAAPEMYEALRNLSAIVDAAILSGDWKVDGACDPDMDIKAARAALAKATGGQ